MFDQRRDHSIGASPDDPVGKSHHQITKLPDAQIDPMTNLWSGRFDAAPDAETFSFGSSFRFDRRLFEDDTTGSIAWARALARAGVLQPGEAARIEAALT